VSDRRAFVAGTLALAAFPARAAKPPPPPKIGAIHWPGPGYELHGYMAVPAKAHGPQPAVLLVPDASGADQYALGMTDALALAGFVACVPKTIASIDDAVATVRWLRTNPYSTGKVAAIGLGRGGEIVRQISSATQSGLAAAILFGAASLAQSEPPMLALDSAAQLAAAGGDVYDRAWQSVIDFLKEHLT
jgi:dienelactone hydrolase